MSRLTLLQKDPRQIGNWAAAVFQAGRFAVAFLSVAALTLAATCMESHSHCWPCIAISLSALMFHRIHCDREYCIKPEGYIGMVVWPLHRRFC